MNHKCSIHFVSINELLEDNQLSVPEFMCLNSDPANFRLLQMQPKGTFIFDEKKGPEPQQKKLLEKKCKKALDIARDNNADLALFPEYCIAYSLIKSLVRDKKKWPDFKSLWCLPCEAISYNRFYKFMDDISKKSDVIVLNQYCNEPYIRRNNFVNALLYCFVAYQNGRKKLVLIPQIKMHPMRDPLYLCESAGLTTGEVLYYFKGTHICLLSLICADVFEKDITWDNLCDKTACTHLIILHPQLNSHPREDAFCHLRHEMMNLSTASVYISCNWADGTTLIPSQDSGGDGGNVSVHLSWSCIYQKCVDWNQACNSVNAQLGNENIKKGICTGLISKRHTLVWFSDSQEHLHICRVLAPFSSNYAVANQFQPLKAETFCIWSTTISEWEVSTYNFSLKQRLESEKDLEHIIEHLSSYWDTFPINSEQKDKVDHFFAFASCQKSSALEVDANSEIPVAWSLFLDKKDIEHAEDGLTRYLRLLTSMDYLPPHLQTLKGNWQFTYLPPGKNTPPANLCNNEGEIQRVIVAYANSQGEAKQYLEYLRKYVLPEEDGRENRYVCIFYQHPVNNNLEFLPKKQTHITDGEEFKSYSNITDGGDDD